MITGIGSFPFTNIDEAIDVILDTCPDIPFWPQLPKRVAYENMYLPFLEGVPCTVVDEEQGTVFMDTEKTEGIEEFYENVQTGNLDVFAISERYAPGFYRFLERLQATITTPRFIKTQITGPFSMGLGLKDENGKPIIYNYGYFDIVKKALTMKAQWMVSTILRRFPDKKVIVFFDEPYMVSFGSAYVSISKEETIELFNDVLEGVSAIRGVHCCGNTDWSVLFSTDVDIVNYDAFNYLETVFYFEEDLKLFVNRGGRIAPGLIPSSSDDIGKIAEDSSTLPCGHVSPDPQPILKEKIDRFRYLMETKIGPEGLRELIITPSCGLGSVTAEEARYAMGLLKAFR